MKGMTPNPKKPIEIPATFKKTSVYINDIDRAVSGRWIWEIDRVANEGVFKSKIVNALVDTDNFWKSAQEDPSLVPQKLLKERSVSETIKKYKEENKACINIVKKQIGAQLFDEFLDKDSSANKIALENYKSYLERSEARAEKHDAEKKKQKQKDDNRKKYLDVCRRN